MDDKKASMIELTCGVTTRGRKRRAGIGVAGCVSYRCVIDGKQLPFYVQCTAARTVAVCTRIAQTSAQLYNCLLQLLNNDAMISE
jgi:hypothetical protein